MVDQPPDPVGSGLLSRSNGLTDEGVGKSAAGQARMNNWWHKGERREPLRLERGAMVAVIGGGPAGAFFALHLLRKSRAVGHPLKVIILEGRQEFVSSAARGSGYRKGCNYCAGGISPRTNDRLQEMGLMVPREIIKNEIHTITVHSFWKNIEFKIPTDRQMLAVYRGSLHSNRGDWVNNFDGFLLEQAIREGGVLYEVEATDLAYSAAGKPLITFREHHEIQTIEADFVAFAGGVNHTLRHRTESHHLLQCLRQLMPGFSPPRLRRALIFELEVDPAHTAELEGEIFFVEYGSRSLPLDMCSLVPKGQFVTVVLIGRAIDDLADHSKIAGLIHEFLALPHVKKLLPQPLKMENACVCVPNMVVGTAKHPFADRIAIVGDMAIARLYKDGILTACQTSQVLAETILDVGVDVGSLGQRYWPVIRRIHADNGYGRLVFALHNLFFRSSVLSRVLYQAIITERKRHFKPKRPLENILWKIASGDDWYRKIFVAMVHPVTVWSVLTGGVVVTLRNYLAEQAFGLDWRGFGRFTTGVSLERLESKRGEYQRVLAAQGMPHPARLEFERMYSIKIRADRPSIAEAIGQFGEQDRQYFTPRFITVHRIGGQPNQPGCVIQYRVVVAALCFNLSLERVLDQHYFVYRVRDGFARDGVLIFEIEAERQGLSLLSIYVAFDFCRGHSGFTRPFWWLLRHLFPAFIHDVLWNHSLCQLKDKVETNSALGRARCQPQPA